MIYIKMIKSIKRKGGVEQVTSTKIFHRQVSETSGHIFSKIVKRWTASAGDVPSS